MNTVIKYNRPGFPVIETRGLEIARDRAFSGQLLCMIFEPEKQYDSNAITKRYRRAAANIAMGHRYVEVREGDPLDFNPTSFRGIAHIGPAVPTGPLCRVPLVGGLAGLSIKEVGLHDAGLVESETDVAAALLFASASYAARYSPLRDTDGLRHLAELARVDTSDVHMVGSLRDALLNRRPWLQPAESAV